LAGVSPILSPGNYNSMLLSIINTEILVNSTFFIPGRNFLLPVKLQVKLQVEGMGTSVPHKQFIFQAQQYMKAELLAFPLGKGKT